MDQGESRFIESDPTDSTKRLLLEDKELGSTIYVSNGFPKIVFDIVIWGFHITVCGFAFSLSRFIFYVLDYLMEPLNASILVGFVLVVTLIITTTKYEDSRKRFGGDLIDTMGFISFIEMFVAMLVFFAILLLWVFIFQTDPLTPMLWAYRIVLSLNAGLLIQLYVLFALIDRYGQNEQEYTIISVE